MPSRTAQPVPALPGHNLPWPISVAAPELRLRGPDLIPAQPALRGQGKPLCVPVGWGCRGNGTWTGGTGDGETGNGVPGNRERDWEWGVWGWRDGQQGA